MLNFIEALDEQSGKILEIGADGLLGLNELVLGCITFKVEVEEWIIFAINFDLHFGSVGLVSLDGGKRYIGEYSDDDIL